MSNEDADKVMGIGVAKIFLERAQNRATFRIRAMSLRGATVNLQIAANKLGELRKMIDDFPRLAVTRVESRRSGNPEQGFNTQYRRVDFGASC
jgi:hypothetical protein